MSRPSAEKRRGQAVGRLLVAAFVVSASSQAYVQVFGSQNILQLARENHRFEVTREDQAARGTITSNDGKVLAQSADVYELGLNYANVPHSESFFIALANASGISAADLQYSVLHDGVSKVWPDALSPARAKEIQAVKVHWQAKGVSLRRVPKREYPMQAELATVIGTYGVTEKPTGLESSLNQVLKGQDGSRSGLPDRKGSFLPMRMTSEDTKAVAGKDVQLTIESWLQVAATSALRQSVEGFKAKTGVVVVQDPSTGRLLAAASWTPGQATETFNGFDPLVMGRYEPGSTFKILTLAKGADMGVVNPESFVHCSGSIRVGKKTISCSHGAHGDVDGRLALAKSCNVAAVHWAQAIGEAKFKQFFEQAGLMSQPGVGLPGEIPGSYYKDETAKLLQLSNFGFGQALTVTPVALCAAFNAIANDGVYMPPKLIAKVGDEVTPDRPPVRLFREDTAKEILNYLVSTFEMEGGTAHRLRIQGIKLAGKTGTAEKKNRMYKEGERHYVSSFIGYVPADKPVATVLVMVDDPMGGQYFGAEVAGPVFRSVAEAILKHANIRPTR